MTRFLLRSSTALVSFSVAFVPFLEKPVLAEETGVEEVVVTGSYIKRKSQLDSPSPLNIVGGEDLARQGLNNLGDIARNMTFNSGAEINTDAFTQNFSTGTANINLRGLGLSSTLVLLNGRRQTLSGAYADDGSTFVDTNALVPMIMMERVETLKDGAAALYGTDAVAGVVNFITRDKFEGAEVQADYQTTTQSSQQDMSLSGIFGGGNDRGHFVLAVSYTRRTPLSAGSRDFTSGSGISASGQPGSYFGLIPGNPTLPVPDPYCALGENSFVNVLANIGGTIIGTCNFEFDSYYSLVPTERRLQTYTTANYKLGDNIAAYAEAGFTRNRADRDNAPSFPVATPIPIAASHPGNPFGQPVAYLGRLLGGSAGPSLTTHDSDTFRVVGGLKGEFGNNWSWNTAVTYSDNKFRLTVLDVKTDRYLAALQGHGGPNNNQYFNPFGTSINATPDMVGVYNDPAVIADIIGQALSDAHTSLTTVDAHVSGDLFNMPAGPVGIAIGGQFRHETMSYNWDANYNAQNFLFLIGGPDTSAGRSIGAGFVELAVPLLDRLDLQLAGRYEDYGSGVNTFDPKVALLWRPTDFVSLRGSAGTSFRAPALFQTSGSQTALKNIIDGAAGGIFTGVTTTGNSDLVPQNADVYNVGVSVEPVTGLTANLDYWRVDYKNLIVQEDAQGVVNAANAGDPLAAAKVIRSGGRIVRVFTDFINAPVVKTDGLDMSINYIWDAAGQGVFQVGGEASYVHKYNAVDQSGVPFNGAGSRNFATFARSIPKWHGNISAGWTKGGHSIQAYMRYIDSYRNNEPNTTVPKVPSYTTFDLQYSYTFDGLYQGSKGTSITIGSINVFDKAVPRLDTFGGFDSKVFDPRQRLVYVRLKQGI